MLLFGADKAYAQRDLSGQIGIQFTTGGVNHFLSWKSGGERHYFTSLALTRTNRNRTHWLYGLDYQIKEYTYEGKAIPKAQFTGELGYFIPVLADKGRNVCLRVGLSALADSRRSTGELPCFMTGRQPPTGTALFMGVA